MRIVRKIVLILVVLVVLLAGIGFLLPRNVHVERATVIDAPQSTVFVLVNSFKTFNKWSPWYSKDPQAAYTYEGPASGAGARMAWVGDPEKVGSGSQEITESRPFEMVKTALDFGAQGKATAVFALSRDPVGTRVVWGFDSDLGMNPFKRYFGLLFDRMIGPDYEKGLAGLKKLAEGLPKADFSDLKIESIDAVPVTVAYVTGSTTTDPQAVKTALAEAYGQVDAFLKARDLKPAGPPVTINTRWDQTGYAFDAAIPLEKAPEGELPADSPVKIKQTYASRALKVVHKGPYTGMTAVYNKLFAYMAAHGLEPSGPPWDEYVSDPGTTPEADLITNIYLPVK